MLVPTSRYLLPSDRNTIGFLLLRASKAIIELQSQLNIQNCQESEKNQKQNKNPKKYQEENIHTVADRTQILQETIQKIEDKGISPNQSNLEVPKLTPPAELMNEILEAPSTIKEVVKKNAMELLSLWHKSNQDV